MSTRPSHHVVEGTSPSDGTLLIQVDGQSKVGDLDVSTCIQQDVLSGMRYSRLVAIKGCRLRITTSQQA